MAKAIDQQIRCRLPKRCVASCRRPSVNENQECEDNSERVITELVKPGSEKWPRIKHSELDEQSRTPENRDEDAKRSRHWFARGHRIGVEKREGRERDDHHH